MLAVVLCLHLGLGFFGYGFMNYCKRGGGIGDDIINHGEVYVPCFCDLLMLIYTALLSIRLMLVYFGSC